MQFCPLFQGIPLFQGPLYQGFTVFTEILGYKFGFKFQAVEIDDVDNTTAREYLIPIDHESFYEGRVFGEIKSSATVHLENGLLTAKIETPEDTYHIEPSWRHFKGKYVS